MDIWLWTRNLCFHPWDRKGKINPEVSYSRHTEGTLRWLNQRTYSITFRSSLFVRQRSRYLSNFSFFQATCCSMQNFLYTRSFARKTSFPNIIVTYRSFYRLHRSNFATFTGGGPYQMCFCTRHIGTWHGRVGLSMSNFGSCSIFYL